MIGRFAKAVMEILIRDLIVFDNIEYLYINITKREVFIMHKNRKMRGLITKTNSICKPYILEIETVETLIDIVIKNKIKHVK